MDYQKMSDQTLDEIMRQIRTANGMTNDSQPQNQGTPAVLDASWINSSTETPQDYLPMIESNLSKASIGKQIGLHKSPMHTKRGLTKMLAKLVERVYLRVAELTNRDIREFSDGVLSALYQFKLQFVQVLNHNKVLVSQIDQLQSELTWTKENLDKVQAELRKAAANTSQQVDALHAVLSQEQEQLQEVLDGKINQTQQVFNSKVDQIQRQLDSKLDQNHQQLESELIQKHQQFESKLVQVSLQEAESKQDLMTSQERLRADVIQDMESRTAVLVERNNQNLLEICKLNEQLAGLKGVVRWTNNEQFTEAVAAKSITSALENPVFYHEFEEKFRGTQEDIRHRLEVYLPVLSSHFETWSDKKFLDIGCGRGEWLDILKANDVTNYTGLDLNDIQLEICRAKGHPAVKADCLQYIQQLPAESLDVITGMQIIEHLSLDVLLALLVECKRVLRANGIVLFETPNNSNLITAATWFYTDPTHTKPIHKEVARFFVEHTGFKDVQVLEVNPAIYSPTLVRPTCFDGNQTVWDENVDLLNGLLYGAQDYAVLGVKL